MTDKLTPTQVLWQVAHAWQDWKNDGVALSFAEHLILRAAVIEACAAVADDVASGRVTEWGPPSNQSRKIARGIAKAIRAMKVQP